MDVYCFEKSLAERMEESCNVLQCKGSPVSASEVRDEWACHVELKIEPAGWQAVWKINRATCEQYRIKYPTVVLGVVNGVYFQDLIANFSVSAVQDDDVHLPVVHEVPLEDLWPTIDQENTALTVDRTADCLDELRFFYRNVWMPWDSDSEEEIDWCKKHLESRIRFCFDLKQGMSRVMADHIRNLLTEARYIQNKREIMELEMSDDECAEEDPQKIEEFFRMQLRMIEIRNEIEMLENPVLRRTYEDIHFKIKSNNNNVQCDQKTNYIITTKDAIAKQMEYFGAVEKLVGGDGVQFAPSLKDCLNMCASRDNIFLPSGRHSIKVQMKLNSGGMLMSTNNVSNKTDISSNIFLAPKNNTIITSDENNVVLSFDGDYKIENMVIDCRLVRFGVFAKAGTVTFKNCRLIGDSASSIGIGIAITGDAKVILENTVIQNFGTAITCTSGGSLEMNNSTIFDCKTGLEVGDMSIVIFKSSEISKNSDYGVFYKTNVKNIIVNGEKKKIVDNFDELRGFIPTLTLKGDCSFKENQKGNIAIVDQKTASLQHSEFLEDTYECDLINTDVSIPNVKLPTNGHSSPILIEDNEKNDISIISID